MHCISWKFPGLCAAELDVQGQHNITTIHFCTELNPVVAADLVQRYTISTRDPHHVSVAKGALLELMIDRMLLLAFALVHNSNLERGFAHFICTSNNVITSWCGRRGDNSAA